MVLLIVYPCMLVTKSNVWFPFIAAIPHCSESFMSELTMTHTFFPLSVESNAVLFVRQFVLALACPIIMKTLEFVVVK